MRNLIGLAFIGLVVAACSGGFGTMDRIMSSWNGAHLDEVISQWGYPHEERVIAGRKLYVWNRNTTLTSPRVTNSTVNVIGNTAYVNSYSYGGGTSAWSCQRILEVNKFNRVVAHQWGGNNCPFADIAMGYQNWERRGGPPN